MRKREKSNIPESNSSHDREMDLEFGDVQDVLQSVRDTHHLAAEKPEFYWIKQHDAIIEKLDTPALVPSSKFRFAYLLAPATAVLLLCLFFFSVESKAPTPDYAAGYDQDLLIEVERALSRNYPLALRPAALLAREIEQEVVRK